MKRGISFVIPNEYGRLLGKFLKPIDISAFSWRIGDGEAYKVVDDRLDEDLFLNHNGAIEGEELKHLIEVNKYYIIFVDLQAYPKGKISSIKTYAEFIESKCELVLLVVDCSYVTLYCKDNEVIRVLYNHAKECEFENVEYITDENDSRTSLIAW